MSAIQQTIEQSLNISTAITKKQIKTAVIISIVVGTILTLINQGEAFFDDVELNWFKVILTYIVPFCVSLYSSVLAKMETK
jgi:methyl-accepting chemotaxis protein